MLLYIILAADWLRTAHRRTALSAGFHFILFIRLHSSAILGESFSKESTANIPIIDALADGTSVPGRLAQSNPDTPWRDNSQAARSKDRGG